MSDDTVPDLRARYSKPVDPWSTFVQHVDGPEDGKATACSRSKAGAPDYQIPRRVLRIAGLSLPHRLAVGLLWDCGDHRAVDAGATDVRVRPGIQGPSPLLLPSARTAR